MKTILTDPITQDILMFERDIAIGIDINAVADACRHAVLTLMDELVYNQGVGIRYFDLVFNDYVDLQQFRLEAMEAIEQIDNVIQVISFQAFVKENDLFYAAVIQTTFGELVIDNASN